MNKGFTLIEMIVVVFIIAVISLAIFPKISGGAKQELILEANNIQRLIMHGQSQAVFLGVPLLLEIDVPNKSYQLVSAASRKTEEVNQTKKKLGNDISQKYVIAGHVDIEFEDLSNTLEESLSHILILPTGIETNFKWVLKFNEHAIELSVNEYAEVGQKYYATK